MTLKQTLKPPENGILHNSHTFFNSANTMGSYETKTYFINEDPPVLLVTMFWQRGQTTTVGYSELHTLAATGALGCTIITACPAKNIFMMSYLQFNLSSLNFY